MTPDPPAERLPGEAQALDDSLDAYVCSMRAVFGPALRARLCTPEVLEALWAAAWHDALDWAANQGFLIPPPLPPEELP